MPSRAFKFYQRKRVVNINLNIFVAGLISIAIAKYPVMLLSGWIGHEHKLLISILAYIVDTTIDIFVYFGLHWIANHWRPHHPSVAEAALELPIESRTKKFLMDAGRVQAERFALVPIFALVATGGMFALQHFADIKPDWAFVFAFIVAMIVTRVVHTLWGYRTGTFRDNIPDEPACYIPKETDDAPKDAT